MNKKVLTFDEASKYTGLSKSSLYKMTSQKLIPHYKPNGKMIYFDREELECFLLKVRIKTQSEIEEEAMKHIANNNQKNGRSKR